MKYYRPIMIYTMAKQIGVDKQSNYIITHHDNNYNNNETTQLLQNQPNQNIITQQDNDNIYNICCYWSIIIGIGGTIICTTIWSLIHYYS